MRAPKHLLAATLLTLATLAGAAEKSGPPAEFALMPESDVAVVCAIHFTYMVKSLHAPGVKESDENLAYAWTIRTFWTERAWELGAEPNAVARLNAVMEKLDDETVTEHSFYCKAQGVTLFTELPDERRAELYALAREQHDAWVSSR